LELFKLIWVHVSPVGHPASPRGPCLVPVRS
jgi:hypothetical protein